MYGDGLLESLQALSKREYQTTLLQLPSLSELERVKLTCSSR
jgi:hypothetical protein